ncbi:MAG: hypothetical protein KDK08_26905 [Rhizobiaceae bacterium]|nr:hypothetical protein [Rhizobiaceae bacterium]
MDTHRQDVIVPRLLSRPQAAVYIGVSPSTFDKLVADGTMPKPKRVLSRVLWDIRKLDLSIDRLPGDDEIDHNPWDD